MIVDRFAWTVAVQGLRSSRKITLLTVGVLGVSVVLIVFMTALITGLQIRLVREVTGAIPLIVIQPEERVPIAAWQVPGLKKRGELYVGKRLKFTRKKPTIDDWSTWVTRLRKFSPDITAVVPSAEGEGFAIRGQTREPVRIIGADPAAYNRIVNVESKLARGRFERMNPGEVAIGYELADDLGVDVDSRIQVTTPEGNTASMKVAGIYDTGFAGLDTATVFMRQRDGQSLLALGTAVNRIGLDLDQVFAADRIARQLALQVPYEVKPWTEDNQRLLNALRGQSRSSELIVGFTSIAAALAIASILIVLVTNKLPEIGILKAMGATGRQIRHIFAIQGTILATLGGLVGAGVAVPLILGLTTIQGLPSATGRTESLFPFRRTPGIVVTAIGLAMVVGFVASLIPARRAAKVNPIEVIRGL